MTPHESEDQTRKKRIDKKLQLAGWTIIPHNSATPLPTLDGVAVEEFPTEKGPADYALFAGGKLIGVVEAKKLSVAVGNVLEQARRYSKAAPPTGGVWDGYHAPFLYSSNGETIWFLDVRRDENLRRELAGFHTPSALLEWHARDANPDFFASKLDSYPLRPYQKEAIVAVEGAAQSDKRSLLVAMATGTGKTRTTVALVHRQLESKTVRRVLFLVDRRALAAQTVREFGSFETPHGHKFNQEYEVYHQQFRREDMEDPDSDQPFDPKMLPTHYLTNPDGSHTFVYVSTIQRMAINLFGHEAVFEGEQTESNEEADAGKLDIPNHAFDLIIADECHRGYTAQQMGLWRRVIEHFDAVKIGLTATPAAHTVSLFGAPVFSYGYERAVEEGFLCDYDAIKVESGVLMQGAFLKEGELVKLRDRRTGQEDSLYLEDEREFETTKIEREITVPDTNRKIIAELQKYALEHENQTGRFPKILIFAANDAGHTSHADQIAQICRETFHRGDAFVQKITGNANVDRPLQRIREFRNRPNPKIVVSVDMLTTGVDIPALEWIVFLRPVRSRILWEQMLGRGTRRCLDIHKTHFTIFDCFGGTLVEYFKDASDMEAEPREASLSLETVIENIWRGFEKPYYTGVLVKRLQRKSKAVNGPDFETLEAFGIQNGDLGAWAAALSQMLATDFLGVMKTLRDPKFQAAIAQIGRVERAFTVAVEQTDTVTSEVLFKVGDSHLRPADYLAQFARFIQNNPEHLEAIEILQARPHDWNPDALDALRKTLRKNAFDLRDLQRATQIARGKSEADLISLVKRAQSESAPLLTASERVDFAWAKISDGRGYSPAQLEWIGRIRAYLIQNLAMGLDDLEEPIFAAHGLGNLRKNFDSAALSELVKGWNSSLAS